MTKVTIENLARDIGWKIQEISSALDVPVSEVLEPSGADIPDHLDAYITSLQNEISDLRHAIENALEIIK